MNQVQNISSPKAWAQNKIEEPNDQVCFGTNNVSISFRSGMTNKSDLAGAIAAGSPVGVVACSLTAVQRFLALPKYADQGGKIFIDSGAFSEFQTGVGLDWSKVLDAYDSVVSGTKNPHNIWVVSPDKIGDQEESLCRLSTWRSQVVDLIDAGCNVIVPIQCGEIQGQAMILRVTAILGRSNWVAGIPSNKKAMSALECSTLSHRAFHILGRVQKDGDQLERLAALCFLNPSCVITADANWLRSHLEVIQDYTASEEAFRAGNVPTFLSSIDHPRVRAVSRAICSETKWGN